MFSIKNKRKLLNPLALILTTCLTAGASMHTSAEVNDIHFLIPGGAGGGWDGTARGTGEALTKSGLLKSASFENMSGGGGGKAIAHLVEIAGQDNKNTLMVNSTPIVIRYLYKVFPQSFRDLTPIAATIGDYGAFAVRNESKYQTFEEVMKKLKANPKSVKFGGGSARGSMDHLVPAMVVKKAGASPSELIYVAYDAGGKAMAGLLSGEVDVLSTGLSEALTLAKAGEIRILAMTGNKRSDGAPDVPTVKEQGIDVTFVNWRGFFAAPGISDSKKNEYISLLEKMYDTQEWEKVRARNGWEEIFKPDAEFIGFLETQEETMKDLLIELGFMK